MLFLPIALLANACASTPCTGRLELLDSAALHGPVVQLGDVADLTVLPAYLRRAADNVALLRLGGRDSRVTVPKQLLLDRARLSIPALAGWLPVHANGVVELKIVDADSKPQAPVQLCLRTKRPVAIQSSVRTADFEPVHCPSRRPARAFRFDAATDTVQTSRPLAAGEVVTRFTGYGSQAVARGDSLNLRARSGPVTVTRKVEALQSAEEGHKVFVRTADGEVLVAHVGAIEP